MPFRSTASRSVGLSVLVLVVATASGCSDGGTGADETAASPFGVTLKTSPKWPFPNPDASEKDAEFVGNSTSFGELGKPAGGCGVPEDQLESPDFVALNVQDTPDQMERFERPIVKPEQTPHIGMFANGKNCGRWVRVTIGDVCSASNDGDFNKPFCDKGSWKSDDLNGATLDMLVADSCQDPNGWCFKDRYHLDLHTSSLPRFKKNGTPLDQIKTKSGTPAWGPSSGWPNRKVSWKFIEAPNYKGDIRIGFRKNSKKEWGAIVITNLKNGIHSVEEWAGGSWKPIAMESDNGQSYRFESAHDHYKIRIRDVNGQLIQNGRVYDFDLPEACGSLCTADYTPVTYSTSNR